MRSGLRLTQEPHTNLRITLRPAINLVWHKGVTSLQAPRSTRPHSARGQALWPKAKQITSSPPHSAGARRRSRPHFSLAAVKWFAATIKCEHPDHRSFRVSMPIFISYAGQPSLYQKDAGGRSFDAFSKYPTEWSVVPGSIRCMTGPPDKAATVFAKPHPTINRQTGIYFPGQSQDALGLGDRLIRHLYPGVQFP